MLKKGKSATPTCLMSVDIAGAEKHRLKFFELSANTVAFVRLTQVLAGATREKKGNKGGGAPVRLSDTWRLSGVSEIYILGEEKHVNQQFMALSRN